MTSGSTQWPSHIPIYVISINPTRQQRFKQRFRGGEVNFWDGTHGKTMDIGKLKRDGVLKTNELTRGEIGCYDSHQRLWEFMIKSNIPMAIICEDDVNLTGDANQSQYFNTLLSELSNTNYDILFLSWFRPSGGSSVTSHTHSQWCFHQLWAYLITLDGSKKLLSDNRVKQMHVPVDVAMWESHTRSNVRNLVAFPPVCLTVGEYSDTRNIR
jgi:glycosyl transferase family 25